MDPPSARRWTKSRHRGIHRARAARHGNMLESGGFGFMLGVRGYIQVQGQRSTEYTVYNMACVRFIYYGIWAWVYGYDHGILVCVVARGIE
jgi:hypothetical protein